MHQLDIKVLNTSSYVYGMEYVCYKASLFLLLELCFSLLSISLWIFLLCLLPIFITGTLFFVVIHSFMDISVCFQFLLLVLYFSLLSIFYGYFYYDCFQFLLLVLCFSLLSMFYCVCFYVFTKGATKIAANIPRVKFWSAVAEFWDYCCWYSIIFFYKFMLCESLYCLFKLH